MRPKYILWLVVAALAISWYFFDPDARYDAALHTQQPASLVAVAPGAP